MASANSRNDRIYLLNEVTPGVIPGVPSGSNFCRHSKVQLSASPNLWQPTYKTGTRSRQQQILANYGPGSWSYECEFIPSGNGTTAPDMGPILSSIAGQAPSISGGIVTYNISDLLSTFTMYRYMGILGNVLLSKVGFGAVAATWSIKGGIGVNGVMITASGPCQYVFSSEKFASLTDGEQRKGGLTGGTFPAEPGSQTANGTPCRGTKGSFVEGGSSRLIATVVGITINGTTGNSEEFAFNDDVPSQFVGGPRTVGVSSNYHNDNYQALLDVRAAGEEGTPIDFVAVFGTSTFNRIRVTLKNVQPANPDDDDSSPRFRQTVADSAAHPTALATTDEVKLEIF